MRLNKAILLAVMTCASLPTWAAADYDDSQTIKDQIATYGRLFGAKDSAALSRMWTDDGTFTDSSGHKFSGQAQIQNAFDSIFAASPGALTITLDSLKFVSPDVAIEDGHTLTAPATQATYSVMHVKRNGEWRMYSATEKTIDQKTSLSDLDWLSGDWIIQDNQVTTGTLQVSKNTPPGFISVSYLDDKGAVNAVEIIGINPATGKINSSSFTKGGGVGVNIWLKQTDGWLKISQSKEIDGKVGKASYKLVKVSADRFTWSSANRSLGKTNLGNLTTLTAIKKTGAR